MIKGKLTPASIYHSITANSQKQYCVFKGFYNGRLTLLIDSAQACNTASTQTLPASVGMQLYDKQTKKGVELSYNCNGTSHFCYLNDVTRIPIIRYDETQIQSQLPILGITPTGVLRKQLVTVDYLDNINNKIEDLENNIERLEDRIERIKKNINNDIILLNRLLKELQDNMASEISNETLQAQIDAINGQIQQINSDIATHNTWASQEYVKSNNKVTEIEEKLDSVNDGMASLTTWVTSLERNQTNYYAPLVPPVKINRNNIVLTLSSFTAVLSGSDDPVISWVAVACHPKTGQWLIAGNVKGCYLYSNDDGVTWVPKYIPGLTNIASTISPKATGWYLGEYNAPYYYLVNDITIQNTTPARKGSSALLHVDSSAGVEQACQINALYISNDNVIVVGTRGSFAYSLDEGVTFQRPGSSDAVLTAQLLQPYSVIHVSSNNKLLAVPALTELGVCNIETINVEMLFSESPTINNIDISSNISSNGQNNQLELKSMCCDMEGKLYIGYNTGNSIITVNTANDTVSVDTYNSNSSYQTFNNLWCIPHYYSDTVWSINGRQIYKYTKSIYTGKSNVADGIFTLKSAGEYEVREHGVNRTYSYSLKTGKTIFLGSNSIIYSI